MVNNRTALQNAVLLNWCWVSFVHTSAVMANFETFLNCPFHPGTMPRSGGWLDSVSMVLYFEFSATMLFIFWTFCMFTFNFVHRMDNNTDTAQQICRMMFHFSQIIYFKLLFFVLFLLQKWCLNGFLDNTFCEYNPFPLLAIVYLSSVLRELPGDKPVTTTT